MPHSKAQTPEGEESAVERSEALDALEQAEAVGARHMLSGCARHGTERARCKSSCQVFAEPKARIRARASTVRWSLKGLRRNTRP
jgi:hypothetical protein